MKNNRKEFLTRKKTERREKRIKKYVETLSEAKAKKLLINYMFEEFAKNEDDPYEDEDW